MSYHYLGSSFFLAGFSASLDIMECKSHTDCVIEDHLSGGRDIVVEKIASVALQREISIKWPRVMPEFIVQLGRKLNPF